MNTIYAMTLAAGLALGDQEIIMLNERVPGTAAGQKTFTISDRSSGEVVKGAPYTAESVTEHVQALADGNRISHSNKSSFARDSEGRTRRETTIRGLGPIGQTEEPVVSVFINDPVAKLQYTLDAKRKVAMKQKSEGGMNIRIAASLHGAAPAQGATFIGEDVIVERKIVTGTKDTHKVDAHIAMQARTAAGVKKEDLGTRNIEGVSAKGTRMVMTIAAGEVGNERPIEVVTETWYSDEIKAVVLTKHIDPRSGEMTNRLSNVRLGEPSKTLFEPPSDYKVEEVSNMRTPMIAPTIRVKEDR